MKKWGIALLAGIVSLAGAGVWRTRAAADDAGIDVRKLLIFSKTGGAAKVIWVAKHPNVHKGADGSGSDLDGELEIYYADTPANRAILDLPSPWFSNNGGKAKFYNPGAPNAPSAVKVARLKNLKSATVNAKGLGGIDISTDPGAGGIVTVLTIRNAADGQTHRMCTLFSDAAGSVISRRALAGGHKLIAKFGRQTTCPGGPTPSCTDGSRNGAETDVDCGGAACDPCPDGRECLSPTDCDSGVCSGGVCQAPACNDTVQNGLETDLDCGGPSCPDCPPGSSCNVGADCATGLCGSGICQPPPASCTDMVLNGTETDIDCGGPICPDCAPGRTCILGSDCTSGVCTGQICQSPTCNDGVKNGTESDVDCGGNCGPCGPGFTCGSGSDCTSGVCTGQVCQSPACNDGVKNGIESDVDCGGNCGPCGPGQSCTDPAECTSNVCTGNVCQAASCNDGVRNGTESDVDCGGSCTQCLPLQTCNSNSDCFSNNCVTGNCRCVSQLFTFTVNSSVGGPFTSARWPGGTQTITQSTGCSVTINNPNNNIDLVCTLAAPFSVNSFTGFDRCFGTGGEDGDGCQPVSCPPAGIGSCCNARPSCSAALNGSGSARFYVQCDQ